MRRANNTAEQIGIVEPTPNFEKLRIALTSLLDKLNSNKTNPACYKHSRNSNKS